MQLTVKSLFLGILLSIVLLVNIAVYYSASAQYHPGPGPNPPPPPPGRHNVAFPTLEEIFEYLQQTGKKADIAELSNASHGDPSNVQSAIAGNTTLVAWQGKINGTNRIFLSISYDAGDNFTEAVQISPPNAGNASSLQVGISEDGNSMYLAWQDTNITSSKNRIFFSSSMDSGQTFKSYTLNLPDEGDAINPRLTVVGENLVLSWEQEGGCGDGSGNDELQFGNNTNSTAAQIQPEEPPGIVCMHGLRW